MRSIGSGVLLALVLSLAATSAAHSQCINGMCGPGYQPMSMGYGYGGYQPQFYQQPQYSYYPQQSYYQPQFYGYQPQQYGYGGYYQPQLYGGGCTGSTFGYGQQWGMPQYGYTFPGSYQSSPAFNIGLQYYR